MDWLTRAQQEITKTSTAVTAESNLTAVLAVPQSDLFRLQTDSAAGEPGGRWLIARPMWKSERWFSPPVRYDELRPRFPDALLVQLTESERGLVPSSQTDELKAMVRSVSSASAFSEAETHEAMSNALADPVNAVVSFKVLLSELKL